MEENYKKKILICDDTAAIRNFLSSILKNENYQIFEAENGEQAVNNYQAINPDIVFMDFMMPKVDGIEALEKIKEIDTNAKVIMCSSISDPYTINSAIDKGAISYIVKPFTSEKIIETVNKFLN